MEYTFTPAEREEILLRILLCGASGHGKTFTALALAHHLGFRSDQIAVIESETQQRSNGKIIGSAEKYVNSECECHHCQGHGIVFGKNRQLKLPAGHRESDDYRKAILAAGAAGYEVLIVDSLTHEWDACKAKVDRIKPKFRGNQWAAWSAVTPEHDAMIQALLDFPGHVIACVRGKEKTEQVGKEIVSRGLLPIQREQIEFEFDVWLNMHDQVAHVAKTRAKRLRGRDFQKPGRELADELLAWAAGEGAREDRLEDQRALAAELAEQLPEEERPKVFAALEKAASKPNPAAFLAQVSASIRRRLEELQGGGSDPTPPRGSSESSGQTSQAPPAPTQAPDAEPETAHAGADPF